MKAALIISWFCFWNVQAFKWNCQLDPDEFCFVRKLSAADLRNPDNYQDTPVKNLFVYEFDESVFPFLAVPFNAIDKLILGSSKVRLVNIMPSLKKLVLFEIDRVSIQAPDYDNKLDSLDFYGSSYTSLPDWSKFPDLSAVYGISMPHPTANLSDFDGLTSLQNLSIIESNLTTFSASSTVNLPNLGKLNLSGNSLRTIPDGINRLTSLKEVALSRNRISFVEMSAFSGMGNLKTLDLSENRLQVGAMANVDLPALNLLAFRRCWLSKLDVADWRMPNLKTLDVEHNNLTEISNFESAFSGNGLVLLAGDNPWSCSWLGEQSQFVSYNKTYRDFDVDNVPYEYNEIGCYLTEQDFD